VSSARELGNGFQEFKYFEITPQALRDLPIVRVKHNDTELS